MSSLNQDEQNNLEFLKAKDLMITTHFEKDDTKEGQLRIQQAKNIICELILLGQKRGRPSKNQEIIDEAA